MMEEMEVSVWNEIYASRQTKMRISGTVSAIEEHDGRDCLIVFKDDVKIIIPASESGIEEPNKAKLHSIIGADIEFVVKGINREANIAVASRKEALEQKREEELPNLKPGMIVEAQVVSVGKARAVFEVAGVEVKLHISDITWTYLEDLREILYTGQRVKAVVKEVDAKSGKLKISVKEAQPHPFDRSIHMHQVDGQYLAEVTGVVEYGVFVRFSTGVEALCPHPNTTEYRPRKGDKVLVIIRKIIPEKKHVVGYIIKPLSRKQPIF